MEEISLLKYQDEEDDFVMLVDQNDFEELLNMVKETR